MDSYDAMAVGIATGVLTVYYIPQPLAAIKL